MGNYGVGDKKSLDEWLSQMLLNECLMSFSERDKDIFLGNLNPKSSLVIGA